MVGLLGVFLFDVVFVCVMIDGFGVCFLWLL
jgi:hypothetical protein